MPVGQVVMSIAFMHAIRQTLVPPSAAIGQVYAVPLGLRPAQSESMLHSWLQKPLPGAAGE
jgi:hypothetical protein